MKIFGFIGAGNMGGALATAAAKSAQAQVLVADCNAEKAQALAKALGGVAESGENVARQADFLFLGVKPQVLLDVLKQLAPVLEARESPCVLVSMAAGVSMEQISTLCPTVPVIRMMPNTPCAIGKGMVLYDTTENVSKESLEAFLQGMAFAGRLDRLSETLMDAGSAISGCGPAFIYLLIEALADGGVAEGLPRDKAQEYAAQMVAGSAEMVLQAGRHPAALKDAVCSPGGSTIAGVRALEQGALRATVMNAVAAAAQRTRELGKI